MYDRVVIFWFCGGVFWDGLFNGIV